MEPETAPKLPTRVSFAALWAAAITLICVFVGQAAEQYASVMSSPSAQTANNSTVKFNVIDYGATGAIKGQPIIIGPCAGPKEGQ